MKTNMKYVLSIMSVGFALALACMAGPSIIITPPTVVVSAPPPVVVSPAPVLVPDSYFWDGTEYVGIVGTQYYYLGPGNVWIIMDAPRLHRFQVWQKSNPDWRSHSVHNTRYRNMDRPVQPRPMHDNPTQGRPMPTPQPRDDSRHSSPPQ